VLGPANALKGNLSPVSPLVLPVAFCSCWFSHLQCAWKPRCVSPHCVCPPSSTLSAGVFEVHVVSFIWITLANTALNTAGGCRREQLLLPLTKDQASAVYLKALTVSAAVLCLAIVYVAVLMHWRSRTASKENSLLHALRHNLRNSARDVRKLH
jgi:hypothetical protein